MFKLTLIAALISVAGTALANAKQDPEAFAAALFPAPQATLATPGAAAKTFTAYEQIESFVAPLAKAAGAQVGSLLKTAQGREVWAIKFANPQAKLRVMFIARVHGDEPGASEGALQLIEALSRGELKGKTGALEILVVPMANPDGSAAMKRRTAAGGDINRDFIKYEFAETRALQNEIQRFDPHVVVDAHEFTVWGRLGDQTIAADLMSAGPNEPNLPAALVALHDQSFRRAIDRELAGAGLRHELYELLSTDKASGKLRVAESATTFVSAKNFHAMGGRVSLLLEGRGIGLGEQHMARRTLAQFLAMKAIVDTAQAQADSVRKTLADSRAQIQGLKTWELERKPIQQQRDFTLADSASNALVKVPADFVNRSQGQAAASVTVPRYYLIPQSQKSTVEELALIGVKATQLGQPLSAEVGVQTVQLSQDGKKLRVKADTAAAKRDFAVGDFLIDTRQNAALYLQILEGASPNGLVHTGQFGSAGQVELPFYRYDGSL